jgi:quinol monooxygenase YgiN
VIIITGSILAKPENLEQLRALSLAHVLRSRTEDGCGHHSVCVDAENGLRLVFIERWRDRSAVLQHFADSAARNFAATSRQLAAEPPQLAIYEARELALRDLYDS